MLYLVAKKSIDKISLDLSYFICNESKKKISCYSFCQKKFLVNEQTNNHVVLNILYAYKDISKKL